MGWNYPTQFNHEHSQENNTDWSNISLPLHISMSLHSLKKIYRGHETCITETASLIQNVWEKIKILKRDLIIALLLKKYEIKRQFTPFFVTTRKICHLVCNIGIFNTLDEIYLVFTSQKCKYPVFIAVSFQRFWQYFFFSELFVV